MHSAKENFKLNKSNKINFHLGTIDVINSKTYDTILVNIDKNVILKEAKSYSKIRFTEFVYT